VLLLLMMMIFAREAPQIGLSVREATIFAERTFTMLEVLAQRYFVKRIGLGRGSTQIDGFPSSLRDRPDNQIFRSGTDESVHPS
jgi:hypothetical protein